MLCESCNVEISSKFTYAIQNNKCPACGGNIMQRGMLVVYIKLCEFLENNIPVKKVDPEKLAAILMANFDIKESGKVIARPMKEGIVEVEEESEEDPDAEFKARQKIESQVALQKMRDDILEGAVSERYGFDGDSGVLLEDEDVNMHEFVRKEMQANKADIMVSGGTGKSGSFSR